MDDNISAPSESLLHSDGGVQTGGGSKREAAARLAKDCCSRGAIYLAILTSASVLVYADRGIFGAIGPMILDTCTEKMGHCDAKLHLSTDRFGVLAGLFVGGFAVASLATAQLARIVRHNLLIVGGLAVWIAAAVGMAFVPSYALAAVVRTLSGVGEATMVTLAPAIIEDVAPKSLRNAWLAIFFTAIPLGFAMGYFVGGSVGTLQNGRFWVFILEGCVMVPVALLCLIVPDSPSLRNGGGGHGSHGAAPSGEEEVEEGEELGSGAIVAEVGAEKSEPASAGGLSTVVSSARNFVRSVVALFANPRWMCTTVGYICTQFALGAFTNWMPTYVANTIGADASTAATVISGITFVSALLSNMIASALIDTFRMCGADSTFAALAVSGSTGFLGAFFVFGMGMVPAVQSPLNGTSSAVLLLSNGGGESPLSTMSFLGPDTNLIVFFVLFSGAMLMLLIAAVVPVNSALLSSVPSELRGFSMACAVVGIHLCKHTSQLRKGSQSRLAFLFLAPLSYHLPTSLLSLVLPPHTHHTILITMQWETQFRRTSLGVSTSASARLRCMPWPLGSSAAHCAGVLAHAFRQRMAGRSAPTVASRIRWHQGKTRRRWPPSPRRRQSEPRSSTRFRVMSK